MAIAAANLKIHVVLILANVDQAIISQYKVSQFANIEIKYVCSSQEMQHIIYLTTDELLPKCHRDDERQDYHICFIDCAAICDYIPVEVSKQKIKKKYIEQKIEKNHLSNQSNSTNHNSNIDSTNNQNLYFTLQLKQNIDILANVAAKYRCLIYLVGFAAETENLIEYAKEKLKRKI